MGLVSLTEGVDVPFSRRLFAALSQDEIDRGVYSNEWLEIWKKFEYGGCYLALNELSDDQLVAFKDGILHLESTLETTNSYADFNSDSIKKEILNPIQSYLEIRRHN